MATVEVFILNYNGNEFLKGCIAALLNLNRGTYTVGLNVIDNNSPLSPTEILKAYPNVNYFPLKTNDGFASGNNEGVKLRLRQLEMANEKEPQYLVFLNNDTAVDREWLVSAVKRFESDPQIGVVGSKSLFWDKFVSIKFQTGANVLLEVTDDKFNIQENKRFKFKGNPRQGNQYTITDGSTLFIPIRDENLQARISLKLTNMNFGDVDLNYTINDLQEQSFCTKLVGGAEKIVKLSFQPQAYRRVVQNAGSYITPNWSAGDVGFLEIDNGKFDIAEERQAICGVSMFIRTSLFKKLGGFDQKYFAYFEDTDLSLRVRLAGYKCFYEPKSMLLHIHCGSATEYSDYFNLNVNWSLFLFNSRYASFTQWCKLLGSYLKQAKREFGLFQADQTLDRKYHLRTLGRALKNPAYFIKNRLINLLSCMNRLQKVSKERR